MTSAMLDVRGLEAGYGSVRVLRGLNFSVSQGSVTALLGANGAGKTTTLRALCAMLPLTAGRVFFGGARIDCENTDAIARMGIAHVPEGRGTFLHLTVEENLRLGAGHRRDRDGITEDLERHRGSFPQLAQRWRQQAGTLSGGEQQMLAIVRAMMMRPRLLLLDEPSFGLAPRVVAEVFAMLERMKQEQQVSMLVVEQNAAMALALADHAFVLSAGQVVLSGSSNEVGQSEAVREAYLGL
jgi:branched-chain amino acid transport system ATP-binding protein